MNIHRVLPDPPDSEQMSESEPILGAGETSIGTLDMRMQALWVLIAVSIVVGLNGVLSWL